MHQALKKAPAYSNKAQLTPARVAKTHPHTHPALDHGSPALRDDNNVRISCPCSSAGWSEGFRTGRRLRAGSTRCRCGGRSS